MLSRSSSRRRDRRHRLDALALHRHHQPGARVTQWPSPIRVPNHADKTIDIPRKSRFNPLRATETHPNLLCSIGNRLQYVILKPHHLWPSDSVVLGRSASPCRTIGGGWVSFRDLASL